MKFFIEIQKTQINLKFLNQPSQSGSLRLKNLRADCQNSKTSRLKTNFEIELSH